MGHGMKDKWWSPVFLKQREREVHSVSDTFLLNLEDDFGCYRKVFLTGRLEQSLIECHNAVKPLNRVRWLIRTCDFSGVQSVLDAGCGLGFTSNAFAQLIPGASVLGVDMSEDAIAYAKQAFPGASWKSSVISPEMGEFGRFSLIYCGEFYPFSRNREIDTQIEFINYFARQLLPGGKLIIYQEWNKCESTFSILDEIRERCPDLEFKVRLVPCPRIPLFVPKYIAIGISMLADKVVGREFLKRIIEISKKI